MSAGGLKSANRLAVFTFIFVLSTAGMILTSLPHIPSSSVTPMVQPQFPVGSGSWNNLVGCTSPWIVRISDITNNMTGSASLTNSVFSPGINTTFGTAKRWLTPGNSTIHPPSGWHSPGPPCSIINSHGNVSMFVEIDGIRPSPIIDSTGDCTTNYDSVNGGGSNGGNYCDTDFNVYDPAMVPNYSNACLNSSDPTCYGIIHIEIDHDWKAARYCAPGSVCDSSPLNSSLTLDVQGFVYYDPGHSADQWHSFSGWEIHAVTAWRVHQSTNPPGNPPPGSYFDHLVVIMMENQGILDICGHNPPPCSGSNTTYLSSLANNYAISSQYLSLYNSSLPNYVGILGGSINGCTGSGCPTINSANLVDRLETAGLSWKGYMESQTASTGCVTNGQPSYDPRHNPFVWYNDITSSNNRCAKIVLANPSNCGTVPDCPLINDLNSSTVPNFMWLTPNLCNDMHGNSTCTNGCTVPSSNTCILDGDNYLRNLVPKILNSKAFANTRSALFITFDEGNGYCPFNNSNEDCLYAVWAGPVARTTYVSTHIYTHYSFLKTVEVNWNLTSITSNDANATPMTEFLDPAGPTAAPGKYFDHVVVIMMENEGIREICGNTISSCSTSVAPYEGTLATTWGFSQQYYPLISTSEPNYFGILGASLFGCSTSNSSACFPTSGTLPGPNLVDRFYAAGVTWHGYFENQNVAAGCDTGTQEPYEHEHNPFTAFADIAFNATRCSNMFLVNPGTCGSVTDCKLINDLNSTSVPNFMWLSPNDCDNMHAWSGCTNGCASAGNSCITAGDNYLKSLVPEILNSKAFQTTRSALFVTFDEGVGTGCTFTGTSSMPDCLYAVWAGPVTKTAFHPGTSYNQYSLTKTIEANWNLPTMTANDAAASPMAEFVKPDYSLSSSLTSLTIQRGDKATSTITLTRYVNFNGTVSLTAASQPTGPTLTLNPASVTLGPSGNANSSLSVTGPPTAGNYSVTVTGTSGSLSHNTTIMVFVKDFSLTANPTSLKININAVGTSAVTLNPINHFTSTVILTSTGTSGLSASISPGSIAGGSGTSTLSVNAPSAGNYTAVITGTSGNLTHTVQVSVQVVDFTITAATPPANIGSSTTSTITITSINHFTGTITLGDIVPSGVSCGTITPATITGSGTATVSCTSSTVGNYTLTITGVSGSLTHSTTTTLRFADFDLTANPTSISVNAGIPASSNITLTPINGFNGVVNLATNSTSCTITPASLAGSGVALLTCTFQAVGTLHVAVAGTNGGLTHTIVISYTVKSFSVTANPTSVTTVAGASGTSTVSVTPLNGFTGTVILSTTISPSSGLSCTLTPTSIVLGTSGTSALSCLGQAGTYTVTVTGASSGISKTANVTYTVQDFSLNATSPSAITAGSTVSSTITLLPANGFSATVSLTSTVPQGLSCGAITPSSLAGSGTATISCSSTLAGTYIVTITGTSGSLTHTATATFQITDFSVTASTPSTVTVNSSTTSTITVTFLNGFTGTVSLTDAVPSGLSCGSISPASLVASGIATVSCTALVATSYNLTITGTSGSLTHSTTTTFTITDFSIAATSPAIVTVGTTATSTITVTVVNGFTGTVSLTDSVPSGLFCGAITPSTISNSGTATVSCNATVAGNYVLGITGTTGSLSHSTTVTFQVSDFTISSTSPATATVGSSTNITITITPVNGFTGPVSLSDTPASGLTCGTITPTSLTNSGTATVSCNATAAANYLLTLTGTSGSLVHSATTTFQVTDFTITASSPAPVLVGIPAASTITLTAIIGFTGTISLTDTIPSGLICGAITPSSISASGTATVACDANSAGNYTLTITGTSSSLAHSATATFVVQDFTMTASPSSLTANVNAGASSTVSVTAVNGFAGVVSLTTNSTSCILSPTGVTGSGSSTLSCTFASAGTVHVIVTGTSGGLSHSVTVTFIEQDFTIGAPPASVTVNAGSVGTSTITVTGLNGFAGVVALATNSTSCSLSPTSVTGSGSSTLSCSFAAAGTFHVGITGTGGSLSHSVTVTFVVQDFTVTAAPASVTVNAGSAGISTITITRLNGFASVVALTTNSTSCSLSPISLTGSGSSTLSCTFASAGTYHVGVTGTSGSLSHSITVTFVVQDFTITASPTAVTVNAGSTGTSIVTVTALNSFPGLVSLTTNPSAGLIAAVSPTSVIGSGTSTLSFSAAAAGNYTVTVTGTSGSLTHTTSTVTIIVQDFTLAANPTAVAAQVNTSATSAITVTALNHFASIVALTSNSTGCTFAPTSLTGSGSSSLSCIFANPGTFHVLVTGTGGGLTHNVLVTFSVATPDFSTTANPTSVSLLATQAGNSTITIAPINGFTGTATLSLTISPPTGLACTLSTSSITSGSGTSTLSCNGSAGSYTVTVTGTATGAGPHSATITYTVQDFTITASPASVTVNSGTAGTSIITVASLNGFTGVVGLSTNSTSCTISPTTVTGSGTVTLSCNYLSTGIFHVGVTGTSSSFSHSIITTIVVQDFTLIASPASVSSNIGTASATATVTGINGFSGTVSLTSNNSNCTVSPSSVAGSGNATATCTISTAGNYTIVLTGTSNTLVHTTTVLFRFQDFSISATSPAQVNVPSSSSTTITFAGLNAFAATVNLTATLPPGLTCGPITPSTVVSSGTATVSCSSSTAGNYTLTITGASSSISHSTTAVFKYADFAITASAPSTVEIGQSAATAVTVSSLNHFTGTILLSRIMSAGLSCGSLSPATLVGSGMSSVTCSANTAGNYTLQVKGSSGSLSHMFTVIIRVVDYNVAANPNQLTSPVGTNATSTITITALNGYTGTVNVNATILTQVTPPTGSFAGGTRSRFMSAPAILPDPFIIPSSLTIGTSGTGQGTLTIALLPGTLAGNYTIIVSATDGILVRTALLTMTVTDFSLSSPVSSSTISPGSNSTIILSFQSLNGFQSTLNVTSTISPTGPLASLNPSIFFLSTTATSQLTIAVPLTIPIGNYTLIVQARSGSLIHTITITVMVSTGHTSLLTRILSPNSIAATGITGLLSVISLVGVQSVRTKMKGRARGAKPIVDRSEFRQFTRARRHKFVAMGTACTFARYDD